MFGRDEITESFGKESLGSPMKIVVLVSSAHIPMRARGIVRSILGVQEILESSHDSSPTPHLIMTDILVRELGFLTVLRNRKRDDVKQIIKGRPSPLKELQLRLEAESARAKLTYVREFYTLGAMSRLRKSKPDLIIDISDGAQVHEIMFEHAKLGVLTITNDVERKTLVSIQRLSTGDTVLQEKLYTPEKLRQTERTLLLESIVLLNSKHVIRD
jgi:hypothetical protein